MTFLNKWGNWIADPAPNWELIAISEIMASVEVEIIEWDIQLREWKERLDAEVPAQR